MGGQTVSEEQEQRPGLTLTFAALLPTVMFFYFGKMKSRLGGDMGLNTNRNCVPGP